jgi:cytoskeletal protein CcmA (bactofilin family)
MKTYLKYLFLFVVLLAVISASACTPANIGMDGDGRVIIGQNFTLNPGESVNGDLVITGSNAVIMDKSTVNGDVAVFGGNLTVNGEVTGDIFVTGGNVNLGETAVVNGNVNTIGGSLSKSEKAIIRGNVGNIGNDNRRGIPTPGALAIPNVPRPIRFDTVFQPLWNFLSGIIQALSIALIALLIALVAPRPVIRTANALASNSVLSGGMGLLTLIAAPVVIVILAVTIILIPVSLLGIAALIIAGLFGWIAAGYLLGVKLAGLFKSTWADAVAAGVGTLVLSLASAAANQIACVGWMLGAVVGIASLGAVVLTRFGTRDYIATSGASGSSLNAVPVPPVPPVPPAAPWSAPEGSGSSDVSFNDKHADVASFEEQSGKNEPPANDEKP